MEKDKEVIEIVPSPARSLTNEEFLEMSMKLDNFHGVFYRLWLMGKPIFTDEIKTACVSFDRMKHGQAISFLFNPNFWDSINEDTRLFVICHEMLHIILNHGVRICNIDNNDLDIANRALDVVVNHLLVRNFSFDRLKLDWINTEGCWTDTVFPNGNISDSENFEYYFNLLKSKRIVLPLSSLGLGSDGNKGKKGNGGKGKKGEKGNGKDGDNGGGGIVIDDHSGLLESIDDVREIIDKLNNVLSDDEKNTIKDLIKKHYSHSDSGNSSSPGGLEAGTGTGGWMFVDVGKVVKKRKWETVIKKWSKKFLNTDCYDYEQWARMNRRFATLGGSLLLPSEMEEDRPKEDMIEVYFFQDVSGSCIHLKERFLKAAKSLPEDRFKVRAFSFDTRVHEIDLKTGKIYGGGGTSFTNTVYVLGFIP